MTPGEKRVAAAQGDADRARAKGYTTQQYEPGKWCYWHPRRVARGVGWSSEADAWLAAGRSWRSNFGHLERRR
jgi:hypothetical protein